jgi:predicted transposase YbfD/YdcC
MMTGSSILRRFTETEEPQEEENRKYPLEEALVITILAMMTFAKKWEDIETYGQENKIWLSKFLRLEQGIPKHDVCRRVFELLKPQEIERCFMNWVEYIREQINGEMLATAGKNSGGIFRTEGGKPLHLSAWTTVDRLTFEQVKANEKCSELKIIPALLDMIAMEGSLITIDAMGCQYGIADKIVNGRANYLFSVKGNQGTLQKDLKEYFEEVDFSLPRSKIKTIPFVSTSTHDELNGWTEDRDYAVSDDVGWLVECHPRWQAIRSIGVLETTWQMGRQRSVGRCYFISSLKADVEVFAKASRSHWRVENSPRYVLDVMYGQDNSRVRKDILAENMAFVRKIAQILGRFDKTSTKNIASSNQNLEQLLFSSAIRL